MEYTLDQQNVNYLMFRALKKNESGKGAEIPTLKDFQH